jgi:regulatory protein
MKQTPYEKTMGRALKLISVKPRSIAELRERLLEKEWAEADVVARVLERLEELGYLNDEQFAAHYAASRLTTKPLGRTRLRRDLQRKKVPSQIAEQALDEVYAERNEEEVIDRAIAKRVRQRGAPATREEAKKLFDYLMRLGFSYDLALRKVREAGAQAEIEAES